VATLSQIRYSITLTKAENLQI